MERSLKILFFLVVVFVFVANSGPVKKSSGNDRFKSELKELENDGTIIHETQHQEYDNENGETREKTVKEATVEDAKTGAEVAKVVEETKSGKGNKPAEKTLKVDVPSAGVHVKSEGQPEDLPSAEETANYIFDSGDVEGVEKTLKSMVENNQLSKRASNDYMNVVRDRLQQMHEQALEEMEHKSKSAMKKQQILEELVGFTEALNEQHKTFEELSVYLDYLYTMARNGDKEANDILEVYASLMKEAVEKGTLDPEIEKAVYDMVLQAELEDQQLEKAEENQNSNPEDVQVSNLHQVAEKQQKF